VVAAWIHEHLVRAAKAAIAVASDVYRYRSQSIPLAVAETPAWLLAGEDRDVVYAWRRVQPAWRGGGGDFGGVCLDYRFDF